MSTFPIKITETLEKVVFIEAETLGEAMDIAEEKWKNGDYVLDADNFVDVNFIEEEMEE